MGKLSAGLSISSTSVPSLSSMNVALLLTWFSIDAATLPLVTMVGATESVVALPWSLVCISVTATASFALFPATGVSMDCRGCTLSGKRSLVSGL